VFYFPIIPLRTVRVRRLWHSKWWRRLLDDNIHIIERKPHDWQQILLTWIYAFAIVGILYSALWWWLQHSVPAH
jgi:hypothetical protein